MDELNGWKGISAVSGLRSMQEQRKICMQSLKDSGIDFTQKCFLIDIVEFCRHNLRRSAATNMHQLTGDFYTMGEILGHMFAGISSSPGLSMNFEAADAETPQAAKT